MKKKVICLSIVLGLMIIVCGIVFFVNNKDSTNSIKYSRSRNEVTCSEDGLFYVREDDRLIHFVSAITGEDMVFCFNPSCKHVVAEDAECIASCNSGKNILHYNNKYLYLFESCAMNESKIYRIDIAGGTKEVIAELPFVTKSGTIMSVDDYVYYQVIIYDMSDPNNSSPDYSLEMAEVNLTDGSYRLFSVTEDKGLVRKFDICDGRMFAGVGKEMYCVELDSLTSALIEDDENSKMFSYFRDSESYYYHDGVAYEVGICRPEKDEKTVLFEYDAGVLTGFWPTDDRIYYKIAKSDERYYMYDMSEKKIYDFTELLGGYEVSDYNPYMDILALNFGNNSSEVVYKAVRGEALIKEIALLDDKAEEPTTQKDNTTETTENDVITEDTRGKGQIVGILGAGDAKRLGVDKTLVWVIPSNAGQYEAKVNKLNELLVNKYGCDFVVEMHEYDWLMSTKNKDYTFADMVKDMRALGHQVDILYSGNYFDYDSFVEEGIYLPLNEYFATEEGQKLYNAYSPAVWARTEREGVTYGYNSRIHPAEMAFLLCNETVMRQYGIEIPEDKISFYDIGRYLEKADMSQETEDNKSLLLSCNKDALLLMEGYQNLLTVSEGIYFKQNSDGIWTAVNLTEEENFIKLVRKVKEYADKGWYVSSSDSKKTTLNGIGLNGVGRYAFNYSIENITAITCYDNKVYNHANMGNNTFEHVITDVKVLDTRYKCYETFSNMINGIASWSGYKDEALKLMMLVNTEAELSNLLEYGIEGEDYKYENRFVTSLREDLLISAQIVMPALGNMNLLHSVLHEPDDKLAYSKEISSNYKACPTFEYDIDMSAYEKQLATINRKTTAYLNELFMKNSDVDRTLADMREELKEAGIDEVIAEINRQMQQ